MHTLYPIRFKPIFKDKVWGGTRLKKLLAKDFDPLPNCGESWELSGVEGDISVAASGFLQDNDLKELIEVYMGDLLGEKVFARYGTQFPLLIKFLDTTEPLSVQVHPDDTLAQKRHGSLGKTEMWVVMHAEPGAEIITGFKQGVERADYLHHLEKGKLSELLHAEKASAGDVYFIPAGRIHAIGAGITLCEIQQSSDVTYRVYDWDRPGLDGKLRELHTEQALDAIDFSPVEAYKTPYNIVQNGSVKLASCPYFTTNMLVFDQRMESDYYYLDSFVIYICLEGQCVLQYPGGDMMIKAGDTCLLPAEIKQMAFVPEAGPCKLLEVYMT